MTPGRNRVRFSLTLLVVLLVVGGSAAGIYRLRKVQADVSFPVAQARHGDFLVIVRCRGELKAARS
ncbi:MAG: membrane-fusion-like protein, partial [Bryobacteraceae bacterium]